MAGLAPGYRFTEHLVQLGDITFGQVDGAGVHWHCESPDGWEGPETRQDQSQREADHGAWPAPAYLAERVVTLAGKVFAPSRAAADAAFEQLLSAAALTDTVLTVTETIPKQLTVRRSGKPLVKRLTATALEYSLQVTAVDPRRYATVEQYDTARLPITTGGLTPPLTPPLVSNAVTASGEITAANAGTFETRPVFVIDGPADRPEIVTQMPNGSVRFLTYSQSLYAGDQLVIDVDAKTCMLNGNVSRRRFLAVPSGWPVIPAKSAVTVQFRAAFYNSGANLTMRWRSAWM
ncbi:hypothetical protein ACFC08_35500 [Streptomyces sp. NPDC056112]|uniref:phage distal tail protein n=1 Tax=Streptomyces sp. NPDC056112 TaxID=3345715 RepID=UPI0035E3201C